jgi:hypothetical protein
MPFDSKTRLPHRMPDESRHRHACLCHAASPGARAHGADQSRHQSRRQDRSRRAWSVWRRHGGAWAICSKSPTSTRWVKKNRDHRRRSKKSSRASCSEQMPGQKLKEDHSDHAARPGRACLCHPALCPHSGTSKEALNLLSMLRLGADLDLVGNCDRSLLDCCCSKSSLRILQLNAGA